MLWELLLIPVDLLRIQWSEIKLNPLIFPVRVGKS
jgi:hypothetical protein